ncbi:hypothetical protein I7I51_05533 [Histoplasma capsulatum]|uniref:Uncharacterized protein n=1 Tax=Ajellomyces capsulatus TaxID=5037 RepID=A0A8A1M8E1_AJECA|nr:hypothetical protein I7I51_05533 [Histoplasma capsulatum]
MHLLTVSDAYFYGHTDNSSSNPIDSGLGYTTQHIALVQLENGIVSKTPPSVTRWEIVNAQNTQRIRFPECSNQASNSDQSRFRADFELALRIQLSSQVIRALFSFRTWRLGFTNTDAHLTVLVTTRRFISRTSKNYLSSLQTVRIRNRSSARRELHTIYPLLVSQASSVG